MKKKAFCVAGILLLGLVCLQGVSEGAYQIDGFLLNLSTRGYVGTGDNVMIAGFIIADSPLTVIIRALGPSLSDHGVHGVLSDPRIELYSGSSLIYSNDNWISGPWADELRYLGAEPDYYSEAAMVVSLSPGPYTVIVRGVGGTTGIALVEVWDITAVGL